MSPEETYIQYLLASGRRGIAGGMAIQPGGQGRRRLLLVVVGCTAALALLAATRPAGAPAELQQRGRRGRGGAFTLAAQKIARAAAILRCVRTQGLSGGCPMAKVSS